LTPESQVVSPGYHPGEMAEIVKRMMKDMEVGGPPRRYSSRS
jgi:hypothetical protein